MRVQYTLAIKGRTHFFDTVEEAQKFARFCGLKIDTIKEAHIW